MDTERVVIGQTLVVACLVALAPGTFSCDESLPPHESPPNVLHTEDSVISDGHPILIRDGQPGGKRGAIQVRVRNVHDEVLQDSAVLAGRVEIWVKDHPEARTVFPLSSADVVTRSMLTGRLLTIGVDSTLVIIRQWSHYTDDGNPFWAYANLYPDATIDGVPFCRSDPLTLIVRCSLRIFKTYGQVQFPDLEVSVSYQVFGYTCLPPD